MNTDISKGSKDLRRYYFPFRVCGLFAGCQSQGVSAVVLRRLIQWLTWT
jgi:hypothetical protein